MTELLHTQEFNDKVEETMAFFSERAYLEEGNGRYSRKETIYLGYGFLFCSPCTKALSIFIFVEQKVQGYWAIW